ncbi:MAG: serine/threonine protein kinase [Kofleriaceae bacterium]|nr:serine/threonine protein kinase [Kofleriaceae bacterium]
MRNQPDQEWWPDSEGSDPEIRIDPEQSGIDDIGASHLIAERFGKYLIVGELALGGMAELFLAVHRGLEGFFKVVVLKRVLPFFAEAPEFVRMFIDEARLAARLEHRNIVRTYEFGEVNGQYYTAMEYLPGEDLTKVLNKLDHSRQQMPFNTDATLISEVCAGLHFAHEMTDFAGNSLNLVHRDVNPANIVLTYAGEVKLIDFGVAKTSTNAKTQSGTIKGKLAYMSPEQLLARGIDRRSDIFSTGVVLWEMLAGQPLFVRDCEAATLYAIMNDPIPSVRRYRPEIPAELERIVDRALARTPADRFDTAEDMQLALDAFIAKHDQCDSRSRAALLEGLFGSTRAEAKRSIAQTRALAKNISLVMKLRSEVRDDLAETFDALAVGTEPQPEPPRVVEQLPSRVPTIALAVLILSAIAGGILFFIMSDGSHPRSSEAATVGRVGVRIESAPPGAAISVGGEPTGLVTPATLTGLKAPRIEIRLELAGYEPKVATVEVPASGTVTERVSFGAALPSRLAIAGLSVGATIVLDGETYEAGTVIPMSPGVHEVRIVVDGRTIARQTVEGKPGDQRWRLAGTKLEPFGN